MKVLGEKIISRRGVEAEGRGWRKRERRKKDQLPRALFERSVNLRATNKGTSKDKACRPQQLWLGLRDYDAEEGERHAPLLGDRLFGSARGPVSKCGQHR